jgi:hypothetical protein
MPPQVPGRMRAWAAECPEAVRTLPPEYHSSSHKSRSPLDRRCWMFKSSNMMISCCIFHTATASKFGYTLMVNPQRFLGSSKLDRGADKHWKIAPPHGAPYRCIVDDVESGFAGGVPSAILGKGYSRKLRMDPGKMLTAFVKNCRTLGVNDLTEGQMSANEVQDQYQMWRLRLLGDPSTGRSCRRRQLDSGPC